MVRALDLKSGASEFKTLTHHQLDLLQVVSGLIIIPQLLLHVVNWCWQQNFEKECFESQRGRNLTSGVMHLSAAIPGRVPHGTYAGMAWDLLTLVANFKAGMKGLDCFCSFVARSPRKDPRDS